MKTKPISKEIELSIKALSAAIFMATICMHMIVGFVLRLLNVYEGYLHVSFAFLMQGMVISMTGAAAWVLSFGYGKAWSFGARYVLAAVISMVVAGVSMLVPAIHAAELHLYWLASGLICSFAFGTAIAVLSEKRLKISGACSVLLWEL
ncbi:MAG: hypothetical protein FWC71_10720 [Defluviitaleaceae bacterium]|nr:hypothetical protein [Defluviitaleaceae bacterium]